MAEGFSVDIRGLKELDRKLRALDNRVKGKLVRTAVKTGALVIKNQAQSNAESIVGGEMGGLLAKNLQVRAFKKRRWGSYGVSVRLKSGEIRFIWITQDGTRHYIPSDLEFGHQDRAGGMVPAIPFMRPAFDSKVRLAERTIARILGFVLAKGISITARE